MFLDDNDLWKKISKWVIVTVSACLLIFLGVRYISSIAMAVDWLVNLFSPLLLGLVFSAVLNVPLGTIEGHLFRKKPSRWKERARRPVGILLSVLLVLGVLFGVSFLVVPELADAIGVIGTMLVQQLEDMAQLEGSIDYSAIPYGDLLSQIDIDWAALQNTLSSFLSQLGDSAVDATMSALQGVASSVANCFIGLIFAVYILANKETLRRQLLRLIRVWLPQRAGAGLVHVAQVCGRVFSQFVAGQTIEAFILGSLCTIGMLILRLPYAPMIGALVGVTALIPYVGAWIATVVGAFMILTVSPLKAVVFVVFLLVLQQIEGNLIYPRVVGAKINLPGIWVLVAITVGGNLAGPIGMLLGVPTVSAAYALLREATERREQQKAEEA